jgi:hypothetical protein
MILVDMNQVMISSLMAQLHGQNMQLEEDLVRHMVLNSLRTNRQKFFDDYGELIICCDDKNYWRKKIFPYYKAARKTYRDKSELDWNMIFGVLNSIREDLKTVFPYKVIQIDTAEADDIIATIVHDCAGAHLLNGGSEPILILSGDKDYIQLHTYENVKQYDPVRKRWISHDHPDMFLKEHIVKGDRSDGIPNILSKDDCFINGRQKPLRTKTLNSIMEMDVSEITQQSFLVNWNRNKRLVDLSLVPDDIKNQVKEAYEASNNKSRDQLFNYFVKNRLKNLMEHIGEF